MGIITSLLFLVSFQAYAAKPVVTNITGASNFTLTGTITAFGGFAGTACTGVDVDTTCDNCAGAGLTACNPTRAYDTLRLRIYATHTDTGNLILVRPSDNTVISTAPFSSESAYAPWSAICASLTNGTSTCDTSPGKDGTVRICVDKDLGGDYDSGEECEDVRIKISQMATGGGFDIADTNNGITDFVPYPGDDKIYIEDPLTSANFPNLSSGGKIIGVRVFIGQDNMTNAKPGAGLTPVDLSVVEDGNTLDNSIVDGLTNGTKYWFRLGLRDEANNIGYFWPNDGYVDVNGANCDTSECVYSATPDEVVGLLTEDMNCFIASAAYGTSFNDKLDTFREFRFKRLLPTEWGKRFVKAYYHYGPFAARYIHDKPVMRAAARGLLWPAYGYSRLALRFGLWQATLISLFAMTALIALPLIGVRRFFTRA